MTTKTLTKEDKLIGSDTHIFIKNVVSNAGMSSGHVFHNNVIVTLPLIQLSF